MSEKTPATMLDDERTPPWETAPDGWPTVDQATLDHAVEQCLAALSLTSADPVHHRLARYYDRHGERAGATFLNLDAQWREITSADLVAASLVGGEFAASDVRRLLEPGADQRFVTRTLRNLPDVGLALAGPEVLELMADFYEAVKQAASSPVAARSELARKICARKRPDLFPAAGRAIRDVLGISRFNNYQVDWQVFRHVVGEPVVDVAIHEALLVVGGRVGRRDIGLDWAELWLLDVALRTLHLTDAGEPAVAGEFAGAGQ